MEIFFLKKCAIVCNLVCVHGRGSRENCDLMAMTVRGRERGRYALTKGEGEHCPPQLLFHSAIQAESTPLPSSASAAAGRRKSTKSTRFGWKASKWLNAEIHWWRQGRHEGWKWQASFPPLQTHIRLRCDGKSLRENTEWKSGSYTGVKATTVDLHIWTPGGRSERVNPTISWCMGCIPPAGATGTFGTESQLSLNIFF